MILADKKTDYADWIGRGEVRQDTIAASPLERLSATLDYPISRIADGAVARPLAHWLFFLPSARQSMLGPDGHAKRGGFLPPVDDLPRRMWAGSRLTFPGYLRVGKDYIRRSTITSIARKEGQSGALVFVTVRHEICEADGRVCVVDEHDIVYRGPSRGETRAAPRAPAKGEWHRTVMPDEVMLFRYSALTFNGHRIHYDREHVMRTEGYPGLVVHGPLVATLLLDLVHRRMPRMRVTEYAFRAVSPLFDARRISLNAAKPNSDGIVALWAVNEDGGLAMSAEARVSAGAALPA